MGRRADSATHEVEEEAMKLLLDTHVALWWFGADRRLGARARVAIEGAETVYVSAISSAEVRIKVALGKLEVPGPLIDAVHASGFIPLPLTMEHAERLAKLKAHHRDPFDRLLIVQAIVEDLTLVSHDDAFRAYRDLRLLRI